MKLSIDSGSTWSTLNSSHSSGSYSWTIPNTPTTEAFIKITNTSNSCDYAISAVPFTISSSVTVTQPNGGEVRQAQAGNQSVAECRI